MKNISDKIYYISWIISAFLICLIMWSCNDLSLMDFDTDNCNININNDDTRSPHTDNTADTVYIYSMIDGYKIISLEIVGYMSSETAWRLDGNIIYDSDDIGIGYISPLYDDCILRCTDDRSYSAEMILYDDGIFGYTDSMYVRFLMVGEDGTDMISKTITDRFCYPYERIPTISFVTHNTGISCRNGSVKIHSDLHPISFDAIAD